MKRQIRSCVFETNSSSTHSIAIPKKCEIPSNISFYTGDFGWSFSEVDAVNYFYTAIYETSETEIEILEKIQKLKSILESHDIEYHFTRPSSHIWRSDYDGKEYFSLDDGYIDHGYELKDFVDELLNDEDKLLRFFGGGLVFTGNDNQESCGFIERNEEFIEEYDWSTHKCTKIKNEYYMSNHEDYEWYFKGN